MINVSGTAAWRETHPNAVIGLLELSGVDNTHISPDLYRRKRQVEARLRKDYTGFTRREFLALPVMAAYDRYYSRFDKTYHVLLQVESIVLKGKSLPDVSPLVDANFITEVGTLVLTAGHDVEKLKEPVVIDVSIPGDKITQMNGDTKPIRPGDMVMRDAGGLACSILYGQDNRSPITRETRHALFVSYIPLGVPLEVVETHLRRVEDNVRLFSPETRVEQRCLLKAWEVY